MINTKKNIKGKSFSIFYKKNEDYFRFLKNIGNIKN